MDSSSINIKTANLFWHRILFILPSTFLGLITLSLFTDVNLNHNLIAVFTFLMLFVGFGCYFLANYLTKSETKISLDYGLLTIEQTHNKINKDTLRQFEISAIRGFEIVETKNEQALIIYLNNYNCYKYPLFNRTATLEIKNFLTEKIIELTSKHNLNFKNFWDAFSFSIRHVLTCTLVIVSLVYGALFLANYYQWPYAEHTLLIFILFLAVSILSWLFIVRLPAKNKSIRYRGFAGNNFIFLIIALILILPTVIKIKEFNEKPVTVTRVNELLNFPKNELFYIKQANFNPERLLFYRLIKKSSNKGKYFKLDHVFVTPISSPTKKEPIQVINFWITKKYEQRIPKAIAIEAKEAMAKEFSIQSRKKLIDQLQKKPQFYKVLYNDLNLTKNYTFAYELVKSSQISNQLTMILEPHWETVDSYKKELKLEVFWLCLAMAMLNIVAAVVIAVNR